jgi:hypothetical protein
MRLCTLHSKSLLCVFFFLFVLSATLIGQQTSSGYILGADDTPLSYATIYLEGDKCGTVADQAGYFELTCIPDVTPKAHLVVDYLGYESKRIKLSEFQQQEKIKLRPSVFTMSEVEIRASRGRLGKPFTFEYGVRKPYYFFQTNVTTNYQIASRIKNESDQPWVATSLTFFVGKAASNQIPIRISIYASIYSTRSGLGHQHEVLRSKTTSLSV